MEGKSRNLLVEDPLEADGGGCRFAGPGRGDCMHFVGLPGVKVHGAHDGPDPTVDCYGKPNGWCWFCWNQFRVDRLKRYIRLEVLDTEVDKAKHLEDAYGPKDLEGF